MNRFIQIVLMVFVGSITMTAQNTEERWDTYIASYADGNNGSTTLRMDLIGKAPLKKMPYVLVTGITYETLRSDGFPENETLQMLHNLEEELIDIITEEIEAIFVGAFMYNKERLEYFYVKDTLGLKEKIEHFYSQKQLTFKYYLNIKEDKAWEYYTEFLYPNEDVLNYMADQSVLIKLQEAGDSLTKARRVDHWLYFSTESDMNKCIEELKKQNFSIQFSEGVNKESLLPFNLQVWRVDEIHIDSIYSITSALREIAKKHNGEYDGWETSVEKE